MSIMTAVQYEERKSSLITAITHAEGEFQSASFKELTGNGSRNDSEKAKRHLELLREELVKVEAAWIASQAEVDRLNRQKNVEAFAAYAGEIDALLAGRKKDLRDVIKMVQAATDALARYQDKTIQIRLSSMALAQTGSAHSGNTSAQIMGALQINVASTALSAILNTAKVSTASGSLMRDAFPNGDAVGLEEQLASNIRAAVHASAPINEAA